MPAPAQEDYERVEVTFSHGALGRPKGVLVVHRAADRKKKGVRWKAEEDLKEVFFFELDETERGEEYCSSLIAFILPKKNHISIFYLVIF